MAIALALIAAIAIPSLADAQAEHPGAQLETTAEAAAELLAQLDAIDGPVTLADITPIDGLGPAPWVSFVPNRHPDTIAAWAELARRINQGAANRAPIPGQLPIFNEQTERSDERGINDTIESGELLAGLGTGAGDFDAARVYGSLVAQPPEPNCPSIEDDGSIELSNPTEVGIITDIVLCGGFIGDGPDGEAGGDVDFYDMNFVLAGSTITVDVGTFGNPAELPFVETTIFSSSGEIIAQQVDGGDSFIETRLTVEVENDDRYYSAIAGLPGPEGEPSVEIGPYLAFHIVEPPPECESIEPDDSITEANVIDLGADNFGLCPGFIGDGDFGDTSGDFDFYTTDFAAGSILLVDVLNEAPGQPQTIVGVYSADGTLIASGEDANGLEFLEVPIEEAGSYTVAVGSCCVLPEDPFAAGTGPGVDQTGDYGIAIVDISGPPGDIIEPVPEGPGGFARPDYRAAAAESAVADASLWDAGNARFQEDDAPVRCESNEDDGDINAANAVDFGSDGLSACRGTIGDGPNADPSGDFDFYNLGAFESGEFGEIVLATNFADQTLQGAVQILDTSGNQVPILDAFELREGVVSFIFAAPVAATYVARIQDAESFQNDPFDSGSGSGAAGTGDYVAVMLRQRETNVDTDVFLVDLEVGDVMRVAMIGAGMTDLLGPDGRLVQGSFSSPSFIYPQNSPLKHLAPVGSDLIVEGAGRHGIAVSFGGGPYELEVQVIRSGLTYSEGTDQQILWLDFDGATINPTIWVPGLPDDDVTLSPLADFLTDFGLDAGDEDAVIDGIIAVMEEDFNGDLGSTGGNGDRDVTNNAGEFDVEILNSRDHGDLWGQPNVTRIIVGGTIDELGIPTIGIAQSIDPGNFDTEESTVVLLDVLSSDPESPFGGASLNQFEVAEGASRLDLVARGIGSISSHEAGHVLGNWHTTTENDVFNIMDEGGNIAPIAGVGADGVWGTPDDLDLDHVTDQYSFFEGFTGFENTASRTAHGLSTGRTAPDDGGGDGLEPGVYIIENAQRGRNLHADGTSNADTSTVQDNTSRWELIDIGERWLLRNLSNGQYLDADEAGENFNVEFSANPAADDEWAITETEGGNYILQNRVTGRYLDSDGGPDFNVDQSVNPSFDDEWIFRPVDGDDGGGDGDFGAGDVVLVQSVDNNRYLEAEGADEGFNADTTTILSNSTTWQLEDSGGGSFFLRNLGTGRYLDTDADGEVDTSVNASNDDRWEFIDIGDGVLNVRSVERNQFLDSDGATNNFNVDLSVNPALDDRWRLIAAPQ